MMVIANLTYGMKFIEESDIVHTFDTRTTQPLTYELRTFTEKILQRKRKRAIYNSRRQSLLKKP